MVPGSIKVESKGSYWWFDEPNLRYMRLPKQEAPREKAEWGNEEAGALQDALWHDYLAWDLVARLTMRDLLIFEAAGELPEPTEFDLKIILQGGTVEAPYASIVTKVDG